MRLPLSTHIPLATLALALALSDVCEAVPLFGAGDSFRRRHQHHRDVSVTQRSPAPHPHPFDFSRGKKAWFIGPVPPRALVEDADEGHAQAPVVERRLAVRPEEIKHDHVQEQRQVTEAHSDTAEKRTPTPFDVRPGESKLLIGFDPGHHHRRAEIQAVESRSPFDFTPGESKLMIGFDPGHHHRRGDVAAAAADSQVQQRDVEHDLTSTATDDVAKRFDVRPGHPGKADNSKMSHRSQDEEVTLAERSPFDWHVGHNNWLIGFDPHDHRHHHRRNEDAPLEEITVQEKRTVHNGHLGAPPPGFDEPYHQRGEKEAHATTEASHEHGDVNFGKTGVLIKKSSSSGSESSAE